MKDYSLNAEIIICTENGYLENMSKLLIWSIREFGGEFRNIPIYSYQPRKGHQVSDETTRFFDNYGVELVDICLNQDYPHYPLANKIFACANREQNTSADILIFLDSDIFFLNEPQGLIQLDGHDVILRPVDYKIEGTEGPGDENYPFWEQLYKTLGINEIRRVISTGDRKTIYEYYNSGQIISKTSTGLFNRWLKNFHLVMNSGLHPREKLLYEEQITLAATVSQMGLKVKLLDNTFNLPIFFIPQSGDIKKQIEKYGNAKSIHYHKIFKNVYGQNTLKGFLNGLENGRKINLKLEEFEVVKKASNLKILKHRILQLYKHYLINA